MKCFAHDESPSPPVHAAELALQASGIHLQVARAGISVNSTHIGTIQQGTVLELMPPVSLVK